jgi:hypothetical protein
MFLFSLQKHCDGSCFFLSFNYLNIAWYGSKVLMHLWMHHWMGRVTYFHSWGDPANLRNREVQTRKKRGMSVWTLPPEGQQHSPPFQPGYTAAPTNQLGHILYSKFKVAPNERVEGQIKVTHNEKRQWLLKGLHSVSNKEVIKWISALVQGSVWSYTSGSQLTCIEHLGMYMTRGHKWEADTGKKVAVCETGVVKSQSRSRQKWRQ